MLRNFILRLLFSNDEKYLIAKAIDTEIEILERVKVSERWADKENIDKDVLCYNKIRSPFSTKDYA
jgi:hypothetical protein